VKQSRLVFCQEKKKRETKMSEPEQFGASLSGIQIGANMANDIVPSIAIGESRTNVE
jgi:hypothetical protein